MNKENFIKNYCLDSGISFADFSKHLVAMPCKCGETGCNGWATIGNNIHSIEYHLRLGMHPHGNR